MKLPRAKKRFGQNFLHDPDVIARIVRAIDPKPGDVLVEIGPGLGALTRALLERIDRLIAIELDRDLIPLLQENTGDPAGLRVIEADALKVDFGKLAPAGGKLRLAGNLPYNISTPLLFHVLDFADRIADMHFMLQKEVVARMCAQPDTDDYGRLTVTLAARAQCDELFGVAPGAFKPAPNVDSAVVRVTPRPPPFEIRDLARFDRVVTAAFGQRRKTLANALKSVMPAERIRTAGIDPGARGEQLSPAEFARLANVSPHDEP